MGAHLGLLSEASTHRSLAKCFAKSILGVENGDQGVCQVPTVQVRARHVQSYSDVVSTEWGSNGHKRRSHNELKGRR